MNIPLSLPEPTPAEAMEFLCAQLPERFRLSEELSCYDATSRMPYSYRSMQTRQGQAWEPSGFILEGAALVQMASSAPAFEAVTRHCIDEGIILILSINVGAQPCAVTIRRRSSPESVTPEAYLGKGYSAGRAALMALSRALRAWGQP